MHVHQLGQVEPGPLHDLHFSDVHVVKGIDTLAGLLNVSGDRVGDKFVDDLLEVCGADLPCDDVDQLIPDSIARDIEKACQGIYPLHDVHIRKVKVMKRPRFDLNKLMDMHGEGSGKAAVTTDAATGEAVERPEGYEPPVLESV